MYVYLYRLRGEPMYVGQAANVKRRDYQHRKNKDKLITPFDKFLQKIGRDKFTLETIGKCEDWPRGIKINTLENAKMDEYGTFYPESGRGWNFGRAEQYGGNRTEQSFESWKVAQAASMKKLWDDPEYRASQTARFKKMNADPKFKAAQAARRSAANKVMYANPEFKAAQSIRSFARMTKMHNDPKFKAAQAASMKKLWHDPEYRATMTIAREKCRNDHELQAKNSTRMIENHNNPEFVAAKLAGLRKKHADPEYKASQFIRKSSAFKKMNADPEFKAAHSSRHSIRMTKMHNDPKFKATLGTATLERALKNPRTRERYEQNLCSAIWNGNPCNCNHIPNRTWCQECIGRESRYKAVRKVNKEAKLLQKQMAQATPTLKVS